MSPRSSVMTGTPKDFSLTASLLMPFALYVSVGAGLAAWLYWLMQPIVLENPGMAAYQPPKAVATLVAYQPPRDWTPASVAEIEIETTGSARETASAPLTTKTTEPVPAKPAIKKVIRKPQGERWAERTPEYGWGRASNGFGFRPWF